MLWFVAVLLAVLWLGGSVLGVAGGLSYLLLATVAVILFSFLKRTSDHAAGGDVAMHRRRRVVCRVPASAPRGVPGTAPR